MRRTNRRLLVVVFLAIAGLFAVTTLTSMWRADEIRQQTRLLGERTLDRVELVHRMGEDLDTQRLLVDAHIFERESVKMSVVETEIKLMQQDLVKALQRYEAMSPVNGEDDIGTRVRAAIAALDAPVDAALKLSRENRDVEARQEMMLLDGKFDAIRRDLNSLIQLNHTAGWQAVARIGKLQAATVELMTAAGVVGVLLTVIIGGWSVRLVGQREQELQQHSLALEEKNRELDSFAGRVAHDLRGPMSTVSIAGSRLAELAHEPGTAELHARGIRRMQQLIDDLLALSRVSTMRQDSCDPAAVAAQAREELAARMEQEGGELTLAVETARVQCGAGLLHQTLFNLIENAFKYRKLEVPPRVIVTGHARGGRFHLEVCDNGVGMAPEDARRAFQPFFRAGPMADRPGTGLGLSIVKRIIDAVGGSIAVESELGRGTTFIVELDLAAAA